METSDELKGEELVAAVAEMRGRQMEWSRRESLSFIWWRDAGGFTRMTIPKKKGDPPQNYRPDKHVAQAWKLDGEGWLWSSTTDGAEEFVSAEVDGEYFDASASYANHATKAQAYATARCRAYLKAMGKH